MEITGEWRKTCTGVGKLLYEYDLSRKKKKIKLNISGIWKLKKIYSYTYKTMLIM